MQRIRSSRFLLEIVRHDEGDVLEISVTQRPELPQKAGSSPTRRFASLRLWAFIQPGFSFQLVDS